MPANLTSGLLSGLGYNEAYKALGDAADNFQDTTTALAEDAVAGTSFQPYSISAPTGSVNVNAQGGYEMNLSPEQQALMEQMQTGAAGMFANATGSYGDLQQSAYDTIRATQTPEEDRARQEMEARLYAQGRSGITSGAYGGTPEQLAYSKAVEEAKNAAAMNAMGFAQQQQAQDANIGSQMLTNSYMPQAGMLDALSPSINLANISQTGAQAGQGLAAQLGLGGAQGQLNATLGQAGLLGDAIGGLTNAMGGTTFDPLGDLYGSIFGNNDNSAVVNGIISGTNYGY